MIHECTIFATRSLSTNLLVTKENYIFFICPPTWTLIFSLCWNVDLRNDLLQQVRKRVGFRTGVHCPQLCPECPWNRCCPRWKECKVSIESTLRLHCWSLQCNASQCRNVEEPVQLCSRSVHMSVIHSQMGGVLMALSCTVCVHLPPPCVWVGWSCPLKMSKVGEVGECKIVVPACCSLPHTRPRLAAVLRPFGNVSSLSAVAGQACLCRPAYSLAWALSDAQYRNILPIMSMQGGQSTSKQGCKMSNLLHRTNLELNNILRKCYAWGTNAKE